MDAEIIAAIWGLESFFGERRGDVSVISATSTLAFDGRRGSFFETQLIAALQIIQSGDILASGMTGSWAGAMGHTQFIPTSYQAIAVDFNGDGRADVVHINIAGKSLAFLSKGDNLNGYLKVRLDDTVSSVGAMVKITLEDGSTISKPYVSGEGLVSDSSHVIIAGLGTQKATSVSVNYLGSPQVIQTGSFRNETVRFGAAN